MSYESDDEYCTLELSIENKCTCLLHKLMLEENLEGIEKFLQTFRKNNIDINEHEIAYDYLPHKKEQAHWVKFCGVVNHLHGRPPYFPDEYSLEHECKINGYDIKEVLNKDINIIKDTVSWKIYCIFKKYNYHESSF